MLYFQLCSRCLEIKVVQHGLDHLNLESLDLLEFKISKKYYQGQSEESLTSLRHVK